MMRLNWFVALLVVSVLLPIACSAESPKNDAAKNPASITKVAKQVKQSPKKQEPKKPDKENQQAPAKRPPDTSGLGGEEFSVETSDGVKIYGTLYAQKEGVHPLLVLVHQLSKNRHEYELVGIAKALFDAGYNLILIDARGHGQSTISKSGTIDWQKMGKAEWEVAWKDVDAAIKWANKVRKLKYKGLGLVGASIGSTTVLLYTSHNKSKVSAFVMLSPGLAWRKVDTTGPMKSVAGVPALLVASKNDSGGYCAQTVEALAKLNPKADTYVYDGSKHGVYMVQENKEVLDKLVEWLRKVLPPSATQKK